ncbi:MAG: thioredoxin domain-containing protein [Patescibacteria group bacterium]|jgi:protein-disulfide isomerase
MSLKERVEYAAMKARHENKLRPWYKKWWGIILIGLSAIILIFIIASGIYVVQQIQNINNGVSLENLEEQRQKYLTAINGASDNTWGAKTASITIVEFSDFACPYCKQSYAGLKNIREKYADRVRIVYRDYPLHDNSIFLALSARCAGEQGKFSEAHDIFFENQEKFNISQEELKAMMPNLAVELDLNINQFNTCLEEQRYFPQIKKDYEDGSYLQIKGTPTWYINNNQLTGALTTEKLQELIEGLLTTQK